MSNSLPADTSASLSPIGEVAPDPSGQSMIGSDASHHGQTHHPHRTLEPDRVHYANHHHQGGVAQEPGCTGKKLFFTPEMRDRQARGKEPYAMPGTAVGLLQQKQMLEVHLHEEEDRRLHQALEERRLHIAAAEAAATGTSMTEPTAHATDPGIGSGATGAGSPVPVEPAARVGVDNTAMFSQANYLWNPTQHHSMRRHNSGGIHQMDGFELLNRRRHAAVVLDTPELLMMYAQNAGDSIPATRWRFTRILCGCDEEDAVAALLGSTPPTQRWEASREAPPAFLGRANPTCSSASINSNASAATASGKRKLPSWGS